MFHSRRMWGVVLVTLLTCVSARGEDVFNLPEGTTSLETVPVGHPGNPGELSGGEEGQYSGPYRVCGAVDRAYNIGAFEVTAAQYVEFLNAVAADDVYGVYDERMTISEYGCQIQRAGPSGSYVYSVAGDWANRPVNYVSWGDAARFSNWLHNGQPSGAQDATTTEDGSYGLYGATSNAQLLAVVRQTDATWVIPTEDEWYKAAYHKNDGATANYFGWPTSSNAQPSNDLVDPDPGNNATSWNGDYTIDGPYHRTEVGAHENSESPYGTFDQGGNVYEWTETIQDASERTVRGGSFDIWMLYMLAQNRYYTEDPAYKSESIGFRVAEVPEPVSIGLIAVGGLALLRGRRRRDN